MGVQKPLAKGNKSEIKGWCCVVLLLERIEFIKELAVDKQLAFAVLCCERAYRELFKANSQLLDIAEDFRYILDELWKYLAKNSHLTNNDWERLFLKLHEQFESINEESIDFGLLELARAINLLTIRAILVIWVHTIISLLIISY